MKPMDLLLDIERKSSNTFKELWWENLQVRDLLKDLGLNKRVKRLAARKN